MAEEQEAYRSSVSGEYVTKEFAEAHPDTTQKEVVEPGKTLLTEIYWLAMNAIRDGDTTYYDALASIAKLTVPSER